MRRAMLTAILAIVAPAASLLPDLDAQASEWGCEVLLCASSSDPSWRGVPACHPPMNRLISAMGSWGFTWPTCPEAGTGKPGYEQHADCPAGWSVGYSDNEHGARGEPNRCTQVRDTCGSRYGGRRDDCRQTVSISRPFRDEPYYFDIPSEDQIKRHWFSLER
ncbi:hypothetical protein [Mesorhizobium sp. KR9-304]|uniref:hypothetical protein n=1 Tax=Mesorhizobium sp. KR9-304 TaxID=3156614 RepID=UPI0032B4DEB0